MRNHAQLVAVVQAVCARVAPGVKLWTLDGPTDVARKWHRRNPLSSGERVLFNVAWAVWNSDNVKATVADLVTRLDGRSLAFVASLLAALADGNPLAIDRWLAEQDPARQQQQAPDRAAAAWKATLDARAELGKLLDAETVGGPRYWKLEQLREHLAGMAASLAKLQNELADEANAAARTEGSRNG